MATNNKVQFVVEAVDKASGPMNEIEKNSGKMSSGVSKNLESMVGPSAAFAGAMGAAAVGIGLLGKQALNEAANLEQTKIAFTTMIGDAKEADAFVKEMISFAAKTPFEIKGLETASKQLLAYGFSNKDVLPNLKNLGDVAAGVGMDKLPNLIMAFGQVKAATKLTGNELRQFTEAGVPLLDEIAKVMGKPVKAIQELVSEGQVGFPIVQQAMANLSGEGGRFNNLMEKQSQTFAGMMSNLSDSWTNFLRNAGAPLLEVGKEILSWLLDLVNNGLPKAIEMMKNFGKILEENTPLVYGIAAAILVALTPALVAAAIAMSPFILAALELAAIAGVIGGAVYLMAQAWENNLGGIQDKTKAVWDYLTSAFSYVQTNWLPPIQAFIEAVGVEFMKIANEWLPIITNALQGIWTIVSFIFNAILLVVTPIVGILVNFIRDNWETISSITVAIFEGIWAFLQLTFGTLIDLFKISLQILGGDWAGAWESMKQMFSNVWESIKTIFSSAWTVLSGAMKIAWNGIALFTTVVWEGIKTAIISPIMFVIDWFIGAGKKLFEGAFTGMLEGITGIAKSIFNGVTGFIEGFINGAIAGINKLISAANSIGGSVGINIGTIPAVSMGRLAHGGVAGEGFFGGRAFANGGVVSGPGGIDNVPAMLTAGEIVLNASQQQNVARNIQGEKPSINITITGNSFFGDDENFADKIGDKIIENFKMHMAFQSF